MGELVVSTLVHWIAQSEFCARDRDHTSSDRAIGCLFVEGGWLSTDWHSQVCHLVSMSAWNLLGCSDGDRKARNLRSRLNGDRTPKNSPSCRISGDRSVCDRLRSLIASDQRS